VRSSVPRRGKSIVLSIPVRPATYRAPIDVDRAFFSKLLADAKLGTLNLRVVGSTPTRLTRFSGSGSDGRNGSWNFASYDDVAPHEGAEADRVDA
jgi:hypothetical protein